MISPRLSLILALSVLTLLSTTRCGTPLAQFGEVLGDSVAEFGQLANAGYNTQTFGQLIELLSNLFGSMMIFSEPYLNNFISQITAQNAQLLAQIMLLENKIAAGSNVIFQGLNSASASLGSAISNIGATIFRFQNEDNLKLFGIASQVSTSSALMDGLNINVPALATLVSQIQAKVDTAIANAAPIADLVEAAWAIVPEVYSLVLDPINSSAGANPNCVNTKIVMRSPYVAGTNDIMVQSYPDIAPADVSIMHFYDTQILSITSTDLDLEVCTRDGGPIVLGTDGVIVKAVVY